MPPMKRTSCGILVLNPHGELLLCHATGTARWDIPKGGADAGETPLRTAIRETAEETALCFEPADLLELGHFSYRPGKDLHLYAALVQRFDTHRCVCRSTFRDRWWRWQPEMDGFEWTAFHAVPQRCGGNLVKVLTESIGLPALLERLVAAGHHPKPAVFTTA
jgi:8-oxo-dGTP pyrophosphatase MutT (NUDIX family)